MNLTPLRIFSKGTTFTPIKRLSLLNFKVHKQLANPEELKKSTLEKLYTLITRGQNGLTNIYTNG